MSSHTLAGIGLLIMLPVVIVLGIAYVRATLAATRDIR